MKQVITFCICLFTLSTFAQEKYLTKKGTITFEASVPSFEEVKASNNAVTAILNTGTGDIAALALMKGFRFKNALMEEHFNENYIESDEFPKAKFKGKLNGFDLNNIQESYTINGTLTLHGVSKELSVTAKVNSKDGVITISSSFNTKPADFKIKIPSIVSSKIAEDVQVALNFELKAK